MLKKRTGDTTKKSKVKDLTEKFSDPASTKEEEMTFMSGGVMVTQKVVVKVYPLSEGKLTKISQEEKSVVSEEE